MHTFLFPTWRCEKIFNQAFINKLRSTTTATKLRSTETNFPIKIYPKMAVSFAKFQECREPEATMTAREYWQRFCDFMTLHQKEDIEELQNKCRSSRGKGKTNSESLQRKSNIINYNTCCFEFRTVYTMVCLFR